MFNRKIWISLFDKKENHVKNTEKELILMAQIREESRARKAKEKRRTVLNEERNERY